MRSTAQTKPFHARMAAVVAYLTATVGGGSDYVRMLKLVYLADRESLARRGHPITYDDHLALQMGPVPDDTYQVLERSEATGVWANQIAVLGDRGNRVVTAKVSTDVAAAGFSPADRDILDKIVKVHGRKTRETLVADTHKLSEWKKVREVDNRKKITYEDIFEALGRSPEEASETASAIRAYRTMVAIAG